MFWWLIIWGRRKQKTSLGNGYFNCPHCQCRQPATASQVQIKRHLYFFSFGQGYPTEPELYQCQVCRTAFANHGQYAFDFGPHQARRDWECFKCGGTVPYERIDCPHCGFRFNG